MYEIKSMSYEECRAEHFKALMKKMQRKIDWWQAAGRSLNRSYNSRSHIECSEAGMQYNYYNDALEALENQPKWISVDERLPEKHGQRCVGLYSQHGAGKSVLFSHVFTWHAYGNNGYVNGPHFSDEGLDGLKVYYWMPLPSTEGLNDT